MRTNRGNKTQHKGLLTCGLLLILLICVVVGVFVYSNYLLSETERSFGPPRDGNLVQQTGSVLFCHEYRKIGFA